MNDESIELRNPEMICTFCNKDCGCAIEALIDKKIKSLKNATECDHRDV